MIYVFVCGTIVSTVKENQPQRRNKMIEVTKLHFQVEETLIVALEEYNDVSEAYRQTACRHGLTVEEVSRLEDELEAFDQQQFEINLSKEGEQL